MPTKIKSLFIIIAILVIGAFLYLYKIESIPPGIEIDEIPNGYNAYSILLTGKDEFGKFLPIYFRFSASFSPPLYTYLTVPAISLLGLNMAAVRTVSGISGILSIIIIFVLLKNLNLFHNKFVVYFGTLLYAVSPWTIMYSRSGYEAMLSFLIYTTGISLIWKGFQKPLFFTLGIIVLSFSTYASYTNRFLAPLFLICLIIFFKNTLLFNRKNIKFLITGLIGAFIVQLPYLSLIFTQSFFVKSDRFITNSVLSQYQEVKNIVPSVIGIPYLFIREFLSEYLTYFSPRSLFLDPDPNPSRSIPDLSVFYPWMFIPYLIGLYIVWKKRDQINYKYLLLLAIIAPIPAAFTHDPFWTYRAIPLLGPLIVIITIGVERMLKLKLKILILLCCLLIIYSLIVLIRGYFIFLPNERTVAWGYGYQNLAQQIMTYKNEHFVIDNTRDSQTYLELAFFMKLDPKILQKAVNKEIVNDYYNNLTINTNYSFQNIEVRPIFWRTDTYKEQILVGDSLTFSDEQIREHKLTQIFRIKDPLNNVIFEGFKTNPSEKCANNKKLGLPQNPLCKFL